MASIRSRVHNTFMTEVVRAVKATSGWKILIVDHFAMRVISACTRMFDLNDDGVVLVEDIRKSRQPFPEYDAIYLIQPTVENIDTILNDFKHDKLYGAVHVFFIDACPEELFARLATKKLRSVLKTVKDLNINFVPTESRVFSLDDQKGFYHTYSENSDTDRSDAVAKHLASLCAALGENPHVRYSGGSEVAKKIAKKLSDRLEFLDGVTEGGLAQGANRPSQVIVIDRAFDLKSPLLHELTYQAASYDMLEVVNDTYSYEFENGLGQKTRREAILSEDDKLWEKFMHDHMATVFSGVTKSFNQFQKSNHIKKSKGADAKNDLREMLKKMPQHQREMALYGLHLDLSSAINSAFTKKVEKATLKEQNLVMGEEPDGTKVSNPITEITDTIVGSADLNDKLRILLLCLLVNQGMPEKDLQAMISQGGLASKKNAIYNLERLGVPVTSSSKKSRRKRTKGRRKREYQYDLSRWAPVVKDIMEDATAGELSAEDYPAIGAMPVGGSAEEVVSSARKNKNGRSKWAQRDAKPSGKDSGKETSKLIIYITGGVTYSEMRTAYEVSKEVANWDVYIGSDWLMTPVKFLDFLDSLSNPPPSQAPSVAREATVGDPGAIEFVRGRSKPEELV